LLVGSVAAGATVLSLQATAHAQSAEAVGKIAEAITVRIEGATQGSGVLVKREGNRYTVLTAWHVVADQKPGEELDIYTPDGKRHPVEQGSVKRLGGMDAAEITILGNGEYFPARMDRCASKEGDELLLAGYTKRSGALVVSRSSLVARDIVQTSIGQAMAYELATEEGMSGGPVLSMSGCLVGMHLGRSKYQEGRKEGRKPFRLSRGLKVGPEIFAIASLGHRLDNPYFTAFCPLFGPVALYVDTSSRLPSPVKRKNYYLLYPATLVTRNGPHYGGAEIYHGGDIFFSAINGAKASISESWNPIDISYNRNFSENIDDFPQDVKMSRGDVSESCISLFFDPK